ncbi:DUF6083 domain-containing protein [Streptomyces altiplanensis]
MGDIGLPQTDEEWAALARHTDAEQAHDEGATAAGPPAGPDCPDCGLAGDRYPTHYNRWILLEPLPALPAHAIPPRQRWLIGNSTDGEGLAWNTGDEEPPPGAECRIAHRLVCPGVRRGDVLPWLAALREENRLRAARLDAKRTLPGSLSGVG